LVQHVESLLTLPALLIFAGGFLWPWQVTNLNNGFSLILVDPVTFTSGTGSGPSSTPTYYSSGFQNFAQADAYCADVYNGRLASISSQTEWDAAHVSSKHLLINSVRMDCYRQGSS
jgi:hypothetical protein